MPRGRNRDRGCFFAGGQHTFHITHEAYADLDLIHAYLVASTVPGVRVTMGQSVRWALHEIAQLIRQQAEKEELDGKEKARR